MASRCALEQKSRQTLVAKLRSPIESPNGAPVGDRIQSKNGSLRLPPAPRGYDMSANVMLPGTARCPAASVQQVIRGDGDTDRQPASYKLDAYKFLGDQDIPFERYTSPEFFKREMERMWPRTWQWACQRPSLPVHFTVGLGISTVSSQSCLVPGIFRMLPRKMQVFPKHASTHGQDSYSSTWTMTRCRCTSILHRFRSTRHMPNCMTGMYRCTFKKNCRAIGKQRQRRSLSPTTRRSRIRN
jgi:hypothetical protein